MTFEGFVSVGVEFGVAGLTIGCGSVVGTGEPRGMVARGAFVAGPFEMGAVVGGVAPV
jgi:hypothetical protein